MGPAKVVFARRQQGDPISKQTVMQHESIDFRLQAWVNIRIALSMPLRLVSKVEAHQWHKYSAGKSYLSAGNESPLWINLLRKASSLSFRRAVRSLSGTFSSRFFATFQPQGNTKVPKRELVLSPLILESGVDKITALISALSGPARSIVAGRQSISKALMPIDQLLHPVKAAALTQSDPGRRRSFLRTVHLDVWKKWQTIQKEGLSSVVGAFMPRKTSVNEAVFPATFTRILLAPDKQRQISGIEHRPTSAAVENESSMGHPLAGSNPLSFQNATHYFSNLARRIQPQPMRTQEFSAVDPIVEAANKSHNRNPAIYKSQFALHGLDTRFRGYDRLLSLSGHSRAGGNPAVARDYLQPTCFFNICGDHKFTDHKLLQSLNANFTKSSNYGFLESLVAGQGRYHLTNSILKPQSASLRINKALPISGRGIARAETNRLSPSADIYPTILHTRNYRQFNESRQVSELPAPAYADHPRLVHSVNQTASSRQSRVHPSEVQQARPPKKITTQVTKAAGDIATNVEHSVSGDRTAHAPAVDINELAGKVYDQIERKIQTERERRGL
ncbi:hypothetical protein D1BOALGB6SA_7199 [Olavius sp. associated proteobacterium Delta 1]|nr:hypothetical protein D1BOALGB6SA_7199 [Olavius sp. associated proteobacterium Delta 1]